MEVTHSRLEGVRLQTARIPSDGSVGL